MSESNEAWTIQKGDHVRLEKKTTIRHADHPDVKPEGYELKGHVTLTPEKGWPFIVDRYERNGVSAPGLLTTSPLVMVTYVADKVALVHTENSVWRVELLGERKEE